MDMTWDIIRQKMAEISQSTGISLSELEFISPYDDYEGYLRQRVETMNAVKGNKTGMDCPICLNRGYISEISEGCIVSVTCKCQQKRRSLRMLRDSGLSKLAEKCSFDSYEADFEWQKHIEKLAKRYISSGARGWFFIGGQPGCGKTHICTAITVGLIENCREAKYMLWREDIVRIKSAVNNEDDYERSMGKFKSVDTLYIDDFFKTRKGDFLTQGDINAAFELINYRYNNELTTIISSEKTIDEIISIDEAIGTRIFEMSKGYRIVISDDESKNYRMRERTK